MFMYLGKDFKLTQHKITLISHLKKSSNLKENKILILQIWHLDGIMKHKLSSIEVEGVKDGDRKDIIEVSNLPKGTKVRQVAFT